MQLAQLHTKIAEIVRQTFKDIKDLDRFEVDYTADPKFGDFATNVAMVYAKDLKLPPRDIAQHLVPAIEKLAGVQRVEVAGAGFINITATDEAVVHTAQLAIKTRPSSYQGQEVVSEYSDPNPFKVLHVGHLYTSIVGDAISNLIRLAGGSVHPVNFGGDVGLHVGKTMWGILQRLGGEKPEALKKIAAEERAAWMAQCYVEGSRAYEEEADAREQIIVFNKRVYKVHEENDRESAFARIYWTCRAWSYDYFESFYQRIGSHFEKYYPESATVGLGLDTVHKQLKRGVYEESDGAVVFRGERFGLHTRVFITSEGLPTYETKDVGLIMAKWADYRFDRSIVITGNDITEYMKVVLKSVEQFAPELVERTTHVTHGNVKLAGGVKMASRKGNFLGAEAVLDVVAEANQRANGNKDERVVLGAVKYAFLKQRIGADIVYIPEESVSLEGNSGPYLQYAHARARSILTKAKGEPQVRIQELQEGERILVRKIGEYVVVVEKAVEELMPHIICTYLYELAQVFNRFYETNRVIGDDRETVRLELVNLYAEVLKDGLTTLSIAAPDRL